MGIASTSSGLQSDHQGQVDLTLQAKSDLLTLSKPFISLSCDVMFDVIAMHPTNMFPSISKFKL